MKTSALENCTYPFAEVVDILDNRRKPINGKERQGRTGDIPYYGATGQVGWIDKPIFDEELVLLGEDGAPFLDATKDKAYLISGPSWVNNHAHVLRGKPALLNRFLLHQLNALDYRPYVNGTTRLKLAQGPMKQIPLLAPPLPTQHRIVAEIEEKLSRLDAAQSALLRAQANLKRYRASVLAQACDGTLVGADSSTWLSTTLGILATKIRNGFSAKPDAAHGTRIFRISAVRPLALGLDEVRYLSGDIAEYSAFTVEPGDLLFTRYNGNSEFVGACALVPLGCPPTVYPDKLIKVQLPKAKVIPEFAAIQASSGVTRSFIESRIRTTAGQSGISGSDIKATPILLPTIKIQHQIVEEVERRLSVIDRTEQTLRTQLERAKRLRQSILQQAFSPTRQDA